MLFTGLARIWDVSNDTLKAHDYDGIWKLTLLTSCLQVVPIAWVCMLPHGQDEHSKITGSSKRFGVFFVCLYCVTLVVIVWDNIFEINN